jgi:hypothetical protein
MASMSTELEASEKTIDVYDAEEEAEYNALLATLAEKFPPVSSKGFDFSKIVGNCVGRTAKAIVLHLSCHGWSIAQIADALGIEIHAVNRYLGEVLQEVGGTEDVELIRNFELRKLDAWERDAWKQFDRSCEDAVTVTEIVTDKGTSSNTKTEGQSGNPAYLKLLLDIAKHRDKLLGLARPTKIEVNKTERVLKIKQIVVTTHEEANAVKAVGLLN